MAQGRIHRFARRKDDGSIQGSKAVIEEDGSISTVDEIIFTSESPVITPNFTDEINNLIQSGQINIPQAESSTHHIVDISDQLESGKYIYLFKNKAGDQIKASDIYRIFLDGVNVSEDTELSEDRYSFVFSELYPEDHFGLSNTRLVVDFMEEK